MVDILSVDLNKDDFVALISGYDLALLSYDKDVKMGEYQKKEYGNYLGGFHDKWIWNLPKLRMLSLDELYALWQEIKNAPPNK